MWCLCFPRKFHHQHFNVPNRFNANVSWFLSKRPLARSCRNRFQFQKQLKDGVSLFPILDSRGVVIKSCQLPFGEYNMQNNMSIECDDNEIKKDKELGIYGIDSGHAWLNSQPSHGHISHLPPGKQYTQDNRNLTKLASYETIQKCCRKTSNISIVGILLWCLFSRRRQRGIDIRRSSANSSSTSILL